MTQDDLDDEEAVHATHPRCATCLFFVHNVEDVGFCRRFPPLAQITQDGFSPFPEVDASLWCGEHRQRPRRARKPGEGA